MSNTEICKICGSDNFHSYYKGPIRCGVFGKETIESAVLTQCNICKAVTLTPALFVSDDYYKSDAYRQSVGETGDVNTFFQLHDSEQSERLLFIGVNNFRDKIVCDIGCGAGSFLDTVKGLAKSVIAIEPCRSFHQHLEQNDFIVYPYVTEALSSFRRKVDTAVSFATLEHVKDPLTFLKEIKRLLRSDGKLFLSTPNINDILIKALPDIYPPFFFRAQHLWYFSKDSLEYLLKTAGFRNIKISGYHRFGMGNFMSWLRHKEPKGNITFEYITNAMDVIWKTELERTFRCDFLNAVCAND